MTSGVIPKPATMVTGDEWFALQGSAVGGEPGVAEYVAEALGIAVADGGAIRLVIGPGESPAPGGYALVVTPTSIRIGADDAAGLFSGVQTLRQLVSVDPDEGRRVPSVSIEDYPRFAYRGAMLDVARHFFSVATVKRYIDEIASLKLNYLHLHLTDDQGWRLQIDSWPALTVKGAASQVGGGGGGFYTKDEYRQIVEYAASRFITIVPEIDLPGHVTAALVAYPELSEDGAPREPYEGIEVGFSTLKIGSETVYGFVADVLREVTELTPGPYLHIGGDEALSTTEEDYLAFADRLMRITEPLGKTVIAWHEVGRSRALAPGTVGQYWSYTTPQEGAAELTASFVQQGGRVIMSPADVAYLDIKYDEHTAQGLTWPNGPTSVREAYEWDPANIVPGIGDPEILGIEAPMFTETIVDIRDMEYMAFPRLAAIAEIAWSPAGRDFDDFAVRLAQLGIQWDAAGIFFARADGITWLG